MTDGKDALRAISESRYPRFMVVEGNYYLHRAYHKFPPLTNGQGIPTGAVTGFLSMLSADYQIVRPKYLAVSFDVPGLNFRHQIYDGYKFNNPMDPGQVDFGIQLLITVRLVRLLGIRSLFLRGVESDDVVGALCTQAEAICGERVSTVVMTGDKDINQFVSSRVRTADTRLGWVGTPSSVEAKFGVPPSLIPDFLALVGDKNDGVPGVTGIGPDKAVKILNEFGSVPGILKTRKHGIWSKFFTPTALAHLRRDYRLVMIRVDVNVAKYAPYTLHAAHPDYLPAALESLGIRRYPSLVKAQLAAAALQGSSLFDGEETPRLVDDSPEWDNLMTCLWKHTDKAWEEASFYGEDDE